MRIRHSGERNINNPVNSFSKLRVSTILICIGLLMLPWSSTMLEMPRFSLEGTTAQDLVDVLLMYVGPQLFFVAFLFDLALVAQSIWQREWKKSVQPSAEMVICVLAVLAIPTY